MSVPAAKIPRRLHYVWVGPKAVPDKVRRLVDGWRRLNPDYEVMHWHDDNIDWSWPFLRAAYGMRAWNRVSDFVRMWALLNHGGVYLDTDVELRRPLDDLLCNDCFFGFQVKEPHPDWVNGAVMGAVPGHWFVRRLHRHFVERMNGCEDLGSFYGPGLITKLLREEGLAAYSDAPQRVKDVTLYPTRWFYPYWFDEAFSEDCVTPDTHAIHHWEETWKKPRRVAARLRWIALWLSASASPEFAFRGTRAYVRRKRRQAAAAGREAG
ncbi:MAG: glycosyltransferase family 32 protein [Rhodospirillales bacterium]